MALPANYNPEAHAKCKALYDFAARAPHELSFKAGDTLRMLCVPPHWLQCGQSMIHFVGWQGGQG